MNFFKRFGKSVDGVVKSVVTKSKDISGIAKLNSEITKLKDQIENEYSEIGKNAYQANVEGVEDLKMSESIAKIKSIFVQIDVKNDVVLVLKGITICPKCGEELDMECAFCGKCGAEIERDV